MRRIDKVLKGGIAALLGVGIMAYSNSRLDEDIYKETRDNSLYGLTYKLEQVVTPENYMANRDSTITLADSLVSSISEVRESPRDEAFARRRKMLVTAGLTGVIIGFVGVGYLLSTFEELPR